MPLASLPLEAAVKKVGVDGVDRDLAAVVEVRMRA
jgi:hypothetical protein